MEKYVVKWNRSAFRQIILLHPKYRLIYRVSKTTIRIVAIHCNLMNNDMD